MLHRSKTRRGAGTPDYPGDQMRSEPQMTTAKTKPTRAIEDTITETQETVERALKAGQEAAARGLEQAMSVTKEQLDRTSQTFFKGFDEFAVYGKENLDAML